MPGKTITKWMGVYKHEEVMDEKLLFHTPLMDNLMAESRNGRCRGDIVSNHCAVMEASPHDKGDTEAYSQMIALSKSFPMVSFLCKYNTF